MHLIVSYVEQVKDGNVEVASEFWLLVGKFPPLHFSPSFSSERPFATRVTTLLLRESLTLLFALRLSATSDRFLHAALENICSSPPESTLASSEKGSSSSTSSSTTVRSLSFSSSRSDSSLFPVLSYVSRPVFGSRAVASGALERKFRISAKYASSLLSSSAVGESATLGPSC